MYLVQSSIFTRNFIQNDALVADNFCGLKRSLAKAFQYIIDNWPPEEKEYLETVKNDVAECTETKPIIPMLSALNLKYKGAVSLSLFEFEKEKQFNILDFQLAIPGQQGEFE